MENTITPQENHTKEVFADLGRSITQLRQHHGATLEQAAEVLGTTPARLAAIERGTMYNNLNKVARVVEALGGRLAIVPAESEDEPHCQFIEFDD